MTLAFDTPVFDHPANPYGLDFILFGNTGFSIINGDYTGGGVTDGSMFGGGNLEVELWVSADDQDYFRINPSFFDSAWEMVSLPMDLETSHFPSTRRYEIPTSPSKGM